MTRKDYRLMAAAIAETKAYFTPYPNAAQERVLKTLVIVLQKSSGARCCLGVLRYVVDPKDKRKRGEMLTESQLTEYGLSDTYSHDLARMNDEEGLSFAEIAAAIQESKVLRA